MESSVRGRHLERLVLLSAISGTRVSDIKEVTRELNKRIKVYEFEKLLEEETKSITYEIVSRLLISRDATVKLFKKVFEYIIEDAGDEAAIITHLMYLSQGPQGEGVTSFLVNPLLRLFTERAKEVNVIEYLEDYYHGLFELLRRVSREPLLHMYTIDPYTYLHWRGVELNLLTILKMMGANTYIFAMKHPRETHKRFLEHVLGIRRRVLAYMSHPIRALRKGVLYENEDVLDIENIKARLRGCEGLILFEPTTIDELIYEKGKLSLKITKERRWPTVDILRKVGLSRILVDNAYPLRDDYYVYPIDLTDKDFEKLYGPIIHTLYSLHDLELLNVEGEVGKLLSRASLFADMSLKPLIKSQIEVRDFLYVEQSDLIIAYPRGVESKGMLQELARAQAMAKTIYMLKDTSAQVFDVKGLYLDLNDLDKFLKKKDIC